MADTNTVLATFMINELNMVNEDETDDNADGLVLYLLSENTVREHVPSVGDFYEVTINSFTENDFKRHFRVCRQTFHEIVREIGPVVVKIERAQGKRPIAVEKQIMVCLWYLCNNTSMREIALLFGVSQSTVFECVHSVCSALCDIRSRLVSWPDDQRQQEISDNFEMDCKIPGIIGVIDGTHITLSNIPDGDNDYVNRKGYPSLQLQVVVDHLRMFTDTYVGWPGSTHDARVFRNSPLFDAAENGHGLLANSFIIGKLHYFNAEPS